MAQINEDFVVPEKIGWRNFKAPYTTQFHPKNISKSDCIDDTPTLLQVKIDKKADIRATVVDNQIFSALMPYNAGDPIDFRRNIGNKVEPVDLPTEIKDKLIQLTKLLNVRFSSCDLVLDHHNKYHFLESNLQGNWLWTEHGAGLRISEAIANALIAQPH